MVGSSATLLGTIVGDEEASGGDDSINAGDEEAAGVDDSAEGRGG